jgi:hypothetical protein
MKLPPITTQDGRRAWSLVALWGAAVVFTGFAAVGVYLTRNHPNHAFYLALCAHVQVFAVISGMGALLVKRSYKVGRDGLSIDDKDVT